MDIIPIVYAASALCAAVALTITPFGWTVFAILTVLIAAWLGLTSAYFAFFDGTHDQG